MSAPQSEDKIRLDAIKVPLIHLLASRPQSAKSLSERLRAKKEDVIKVLEKVAQEAPGGPGWKELKSKTYKELDVWKFRYPDQNDRQAAIDRAIKAFDKLRIDPKDHQWQLLLPLDRRGKGECLSKLNFDRPVNPVSKPTPKIGSQLSTTDPSTDTDSELRRGRVTDLKVEEDPKQSRSKSSDPMAAKMRLSEKEAMAKHRKKNTEKAQKESAIRQAPKATKASEEPKGKYKSSEFIEDSDEEMEIAKVVVQAASPEVKQHKVASISFIAKFESARPPKPPLPKKTVEKSKAEPSASKSTNAGSRPLSKPAKAASDSLNPPQDAPPSAKSPRPRNGSSPQKPSPLASSPPTNADDIDKSSTSSKANSASSAASSPPSSEDMRKAKSSADALHTRKEPHCERERGRSPTKRKADDEINPPAKRQQIQTNGVSHKPTSSTSSVVSSSQAWSEKDVHSSHQANPRLQPSRKESDSSGSLSSPEKRDGEAREELHEKSKTFKVYYEKYKKMHESVTANKNRSRDDIERLNQMHDRIKSRKQEIWDGWKKLET